MTENLKRCPFCGGEAKCIEYYGLYHVVCCDCYTTGRDCTSIETACKAWNSRPIENELNEKIGKLEAENKRLREALESIKEMSSYLSAGEITIYDLIDIHNICCDALKGENK